MFVRSVNLELDTADWDNLVEFGESIKGRISGFAGLLSWTLVIDRETGKANSYSVFEDETAFLAVNDHINAIVAEFRRFFTGPPSELLGEVVVHLDTDG